MSARSRIARRRSKMGFWNDPGSWPDDFEGHVFLARAVDKLGRHLFFDEWVGVRSGGDVPEFPHHAYGADQADILLATKLLRQHVPEAWQDDPPVTDGQLSALRRAASEGEDCPELIDIWSSFSDELWAIARELVERYGASTAADQWGEVLQLLVREFRAGRLHFYCRALDGGEPEKGEPGLWFTDAAVWRSRFDECAIDLAHPYRTASPDASDKGDMRYLYVSAKQLEALVGPSGPVFAGALGYVSPYLKLAIVASRELGMTPSKSVANATVMKKLEEIWSAWGLSPADIASASLKEGIATILHQPGRSKGETPK